MLMHQRMRDVVIADQQLKVFAFNLATLGAFLLLYGMAMYHHRDPSGACALHAVHITSVLHRFRSSTARGLTRPL